MSIRVAWYSGKFYSGIIHRRSFPGKAWTSTLFMMSLALNIRGTSIECDFSSSIIDTNRTLQAFLAWLAQALVLRDRWPYWTHVGPWPSATPNNNRGRRWSPEDRQGTPMSVIAFIIMSCQGPRRKKYFAFLYSECTCIVSSFFIFMHFSVLHLLCPWMSLLQYSNHVPTASLAAISLHFLLPK